jgi:hypothetical protein
VRAEFVLFVAAGYAGADGGPERSRVGEVAAERVPAEAGVLGAQCGQAGAGQAAPLVVGFGVGLLDPAEPAAAAGLVVDGEHGLAVEVGGALPPAGPLAGHRVLPGSAQLRYHGKAPASAQTTPADPAQSLTPGLSPGYATYLVGLRRQPPSYQLLVAHRVVPGALLVWRAASRRRVHTHDGPALDCPRRGDDRHGIARRSQRAGRPEAAHKSCRPR